MCRETACLGWSNGDAQHWPDDASIRQNLFHQPLELRGLRGTGGSTVGKMEAGNAVGGWVRKDAPQQAHAPGRWESQNLHLSWRPCLQPVVSPPSTHADTAKCHTGRADHRNAPEGSAMAVFTPTSRPLLSSRTPPELPGRTRQPCSVKTVRPSVELKPIHRGMRPRSDSTLAPLSLQRDLPGLMAASVWMTFLIGIPRGPAKGCSGPELHSLTDPILILRCNPRSHSRPPYQAKWSQAHPASAAHDRLH